MSPTLPMLRLLAQHLGVEPWALLPPKPGSPQAEVVALVADADQEQLQAVLHLLKPEKEP
jgi:hypothetical protein